MQGLIALDIDGTVSHGLKPIDPEVVDYLSNLSSQGWQLLFITGRTFACGYRLLAPLTFPYYLAAFNGALVFHSSPERVISRNYIEAACFPALDAICQAESTDYVVYADECGKTICYYRPKHFGEKQLAYIAKRQVKTQELWIPLSSYASLPKNSFPALKCFGSQDSMERIASHIEMMQVLHAPVIKDPFGCDWSVLQITSGDVCKGNALKELASKLNWKGPLIAAGDDNNDISMLDAASISVVMETAPFSMLQTANIVAPSAEKKGIIKGLQQAIEVINTLPPHEFRMMLPQKHI